MYLCYKGHTSGSTIITDTNDLGLRLLPPPNRTLLQVLESLDSYGTDTEYKEAFMEKIKEYPNLFLIKDFYIGLDYSQLHVSVEHSNTPLFDTCISLFSGDFKDIKEHDIVKHAGFVSSFINFSNYRLGYNCLDLVNLNNNNYQVRKGTDVYDIIIYNNIMRPSILYQNIYDNVDTDSRRMVFTLDTDLGKENKEILQKIRETLGANDGIQTFDVFYRNKRELVNFNLKTFKVELDTPDKANILNGYIDKTLFKGSSSLNLFKLIKSSYEIIFGEERELNIDLKFEGQSLSVGEVKNMAFGAYIEIIEDPSEDPHNPTSYKSLAIKFRPNLMKVGTYELTVHDLNYKLSFNGNIFPSAIEDTFTWKFDIIETGNFTSLPQN